MEEKREPGAMPGPIRRKSFRGNKRLPRQHLLMRQGARDAEQSVLPQPLKAGMPELTAGGPASIGDLDAQPGPHPNCALDARRRQCRPVDLHCVERRLKLEGDGV